MADADTTSDSEALPASDDVSPIITTVYRQVWDEFYAWKSERYPQILTSLQPPHGYPAPPKSDILDQLNSMLETDDRHSDDIHIDAIEDPRTSFSVWDGRGSRLRTHVLCEDVEAEAFDPYSTYESCIPASKNVALRSGERDEIAFVPYATDPNWRIHVGNLNDSFSWLDDFLDPDLETVQLETVRRLHFGTGLPFDKINFDKDKLSVRRNEQDGLLWAATQRDPLVWPGSQLSQFDQLPSNKLPDPMELRSRIDGVLRAFCPRLDCIQPFCPTHRYDPSNPRPKFDIPKPKSTAKPVIIAGEPCSESCFRHGTHLDLQDAYWDAADIEAFAIILEIVPGLTPCEYSILCKKQCREVLAYQSRFNSDSIRDGASQQDGASTQDGASQQDGEVNDEPRPRKLKFIDGVQPQNSYLFAPLKPCRHIGPCNKQTGCACFRGRVHCQRTCNCAIGCNIRWRGCKCKKDAKKNVCVDSSSCRCRKAGRECDSERCKHCGAKYGGSKKSCGNMKLQQGSFPLIEIKKSEHGLGAFATTNYDDGDLIGEYVGLSSERGAEMPQPSYNHGYLFDLDEAAHIDAARIGNETRFLNHEYPPANNCNAQINLVNGEHRIGLVAARRISAGEELLLDYGLKYFGNEQKKVAGSSEDIQHD